VQKLQKVLDPANQPKNKDILSCRSHTDQLCDGFVCQQGSECQSGCCATFGTLKQDYCQPQVEGVCPVAGFTYGPRGNEHPDKTQVPAAKDAKTGELQSQSTTTEEPVKERKGDAFWNGVVVGVVVWIAIIAVILTMWCCCKRKSAIEASADALSYQEMPATQQHSR